MEKKSKIEFLLDTDILFDHLCCDPSSGNSYLVTLIQNGLCFTTVINAAELMMKAKNSEEEFHIKSLLSALKVLGIHSRYSLSVNHLNEKIRGLRDSLFIVTAEINKLDIVTLDGSRYGSDKIKILHPDNLNY
ncbi:MAG: hypothetical protein R6W68_07215 [Ignavibacteriaceae bacterium]